MASNKGLFEIQKEDISDSDLNGKYNLTWVEESFTISDNNKKQKIGNSYLGTSIKKKKIVILAFFIFICVMIILGRLIYLQIIKGNFYYTLAENNRIRLNPIAAERGIIYDRNHKSLLQNVPNFSLNLIPQNLPTDENKRQEIIKQVVAAGNIEEKQIYELLNKYGSYSYASLILKENLDYDSALKLYIKNAELPGITISKGSKRKYLISNNGTSTLSLSHILGYVSKLNEQEYADLKNNGYLLFDNIGKTGLEKIYEKELRGIYGQQKIEVDAKGRETNILAEDSPIPGNNLILSLDLEAQTKMEQLIKEALNKKNKQRAAAIALNPQDGSILALVSWPAFDNNDFAGGIEQKKYEDYLNDIDNPLFNRAISGTYPSGSTIKLILVAAALQEKIITPQTVFLSVGGLSVGTWFFKDWQAGGHGITNATKAIAWSVNTFFYYIGGGYENFVGLGVDKISQYMRYFNLAKKTGIDLPGEETGFIPSKTWKENVKKEQWYVGDTYNLSIGQGDLLVTPLQVAAWTSTIANNGKNIQPHLVEKIENSLNLKTTKIKYNETTVPIDYKNIFVVQQGMRECVTGGSCQQLQYLPFASAGKTGTAQWNNNNKQNHAWFTAFAPFNNPQIVVTVLVEEGEEGASVAMPVAYEFLKWWGEKYKIK